MHRGFQSEHLVCTSCNPKRLRHTQFTVGYEEIGRNLLQSIFLQPTLALTRLSDKLIIVASFPSTQVLGYKHFIEASEKSLPSKNVPKASLAQALP